MRDVCVTVDVEDFFLPRPPFDTVFARDGGREHGIGRIMDLLEEQGGRGTFYVDVYNRTTLDEDLLARACQAIVRRGHELGLHTHPEFPSGVRGYGMAQVIARHPYEAQLRIVREGRDLITRWTGQAPRTHRAGGYGANRATLRALAACGFTSDASLHPRYAGCALAGEVAAVNACFDLEGVREVPVTVTRNRFGVPLGAGWIGPALVMKIDIDWLDLPGLQQQVDACLAQTDAPVVLFLHSYSFLDLAHGLRPHPHNADKFRALLRWLAGRGDVRLVTVGEAAARAPVHGPQEVRLPECRFNLPREPLRWARFAGAQVTLERVRKLFAAREGAR